MYIFLGFLISTMIFAVLTRFVELGAVVAVVILLGAAAGAVAWAVATCRWLFTGHGATEPYRGHRNRGAHEALQPYFRGPVFTDIRDHWRTSVEAIGWLRRWSKELELGTALAFWPVYAALACWWIVATAAIGVLAAALSAAALTLTIAWRALWLLGVPALRAAHLLRARRTGRGVVCQNGACLRTSPRPSFRCEHGCTAHLDRHPSAAGVLWVRDAAGHRRTTLPFLGAPGAAHCAHCTGFLGAGADRDRHRQILVTGPSSGDSSAFVKTGLRLMLEADTVAESSALLPALDRAALPLTPADDRPSAVAFRFQPGVGEAHIRLHCKVAAAEYLYTVEAGSDLPAFDECQAVAFVVRAAHGKLVDPAAARQSFNVLRQRLSLNRTDPRSPQVAVVLTGDAADPEALPELDPIRAALAADLPRHRWFADRPADAWQWLAGGGPRPGTIRVLEPIGARA